MAILAEEDAVDVVVEGEVEEAGLVEAGILFALLGDDMADIQGHPRHLAVKASLS